MQLLTAIVKLFLKRPTDTQELVQQVLSLATQDSDNPDLRDRGYIYWRLLSTDPAAAKVLLFIILHFQLCSFSSRVTNYLVLIFSLPHSRPIFLFPFYGKVGLFFIDLNFCHSMKYIHHSQSRKQYLKLLDKTLM